MNKILVFSIIILLVGLQKMSTQNYLDYYETINKAEIANLDKEFKKSDSLYQVAFGLVEKPFKDDYLLASINSEKLNDNQKSYEYLKNGISYGLTIKRIKKELSKFKKSNYWKFLKKEYNLIREEYLSSLDLTLRNELLQMVKKDQAVRHPIFGSWKKMKKTDAENYNKLLKIIEQNNGEWPSRFTIGDGNEDGKRIGERRRGNTIFYETCTIIGSYGSKKKDAVICDCEKANNERRKIGLEPLKDYFRKRKVNYECHEKEQK